MKKSLIFASFLVAFFGVVSLASAHVVVTPNQVGVAAHQTFDVGVPSEKAFIATVGLKLILPDGLSDVTPNVKSGWQVHIIQEATDTAIEWYGSSIPAGERDDFYFSAQVPATSTTLDWKAYQTYSDGSVVSWDRNPSTVPADDDTLSYGPYSETMIVNDLATINSNSPSSANGTALTISLIALVFSLIAFSSLRIKSKS